MQFGADAGQLRWHQKHWEGRKEKKEQREKEHFKPKPCINRLNLAVYLTVSAHALASPTRAISCLESPAASRGISLPGRVQDHVCACVRACPCAQRSAANACTEFYPTARYFEMTWDGRLNTRIQRIFQNQLPHFLFLVLKLCG